MRVEAQFTISPVATGISADPAAACVAVWHHIARIVNVAVLAVESAKLLLRGSSLGVDWNRQPRVPKSRTTETELSVSDLARGHQRRAATMRTNRDHSTTKTRHADFVQLTTICLMLAALSNDAHAELVTAWKKVDADTVVTEINGVELTVDSSADVFANGSYDATDYGLKLDPGKFESLAVSEAVKMTLTIPSNYRFTRVAIVGIAGDGTNPTISSDGGWVLEQAVGGPPTTSVSGTDIDYISPFVASIAKLDSGSSVLLIQFSDQMEDDPFGFDIEIAQVPEPAGMPIVGLVGLLSYAGWRQKT